MVPFAVALVVFKVAAAILLRDAWQLAPSVFDSLTLIALTIVALWAARAATISGAIVGLYVVVNAGLVAAVGSPLTVTMLAYAGDATHVVPLVPVLVCVGTVVAYAVGAWLLRNQEPLPSRAIAYVGVIAICAIVLALVRGSWGARDHPLSAFALSWRANVVDAGARVAFDAPLDESNLQVAPPVVKARGVKHVVIWLAESVGAAHAERAAPQLARLRAEGSLSFTSWSANAPVSAKAIFTTLCGLYPLPEAAFEARAIPRIACPSLMETMTHDGGARAALFHGGYFAFTDKLALLEERGFDVMMDGESVPDRARWFTNGWGVDDAALVAHGLAWLDANTNANANEKTFAVYIPLVPHYEYWLPPDAPKPFGNATLQARYLNGVAYTDALFGKLVDGYRERGLMNDTLFVFLGDHGEAFDEHPKNKLHAARLYEENVHVPAVFIAPQLFDGAQTSSRLASHVDLAPTVLDLAGVPARAGLQGQSLVSDAWQARPVMLSTFYPDALFGVRTPRWKYVRNGDDDELYELAHENDGVERTNVAAQFPDVTRALRARTLDYAARQGALLASWPVLGPTFLDRARITGPHEIVRDKSFNMERRCLRVKPPAVLEVNSDTPVRLVGVGLTDRARFAKGAPVRARFVTASETVALEVNDVFETTSQVRTLAAPAGSVRVELDAAEGKDRSVCITLAP